jgi:hypothetical protein
MVDLYSHFDKALAGALAARVRQLGSGQGGTADEPATVKALPAPAEPRAVEAGKVRELAEKLNGRNWRTVKAELLAAVA